MCNHKLGSVAIKFTFGTVFVKELITDYEKLIKYDYFSRLININ